MTQDKKYLQLVLEFTILRLVKLKRKVIHKSYQQCSFVEKVSRPGGILPHKHKKKSRYLTLQLCTDIASSR
jgi:hypothetical protein